MIVDDEEVVESQSCKSVRLPGSWTTAATYGPSNGQPVLVLPGRCPTVITFRRFAYDRPPNKILKITFAVSCPNIVRNLVCKEMQVCWMIDNLRSKIVIASQNFESNVDQNAFDKKYLHSKKKKNSENYTK